MPAVRAGAQAEAGAGAQGWPVGGPGGVCWEAPAPVNRALWALPGGPGAVPA